MAQQFDSTQIREAAEKAQKEKERQAARAQQPKKTSSTSQASAHRSQDQARKEAERQARLEAEAQQAVRDEAAGRIRIDLWGETREAPVPLHSQTSVAAFPLEVLPYTLARYAEFIAKDLEVYVDLPAMLSLGALAVGAMKKWCVQARPGWYEPLNLYLAIAADPGELKSPAFKAMLAPHFQYLDELKGIWQAQCDEITEQNKGKAKREHKSFPREPRLFADDVTPETMTALLAQQAERMAVVSDEGTLFDHLCGMYSASPNGGIFLKGHDGGRYAVDRRDGAKTVSLSFPLLTLAIATQPSVIQALAKRPELRGKGMLARFLYSLPCSRVGSRSFEIAPFDYEAREIYHRVMFAVLQKRPKAWPSLPPASQDAHFTLGKPTALPLEPAAWEMFKNYCVWLDRQMGQGQPLAHMADWTNKLRGVVLRIAGLSHVIEAIEQGIDPEDNPIALSTVERAGVLGDYLLEHAKLAFGAMEQSEGEKDAAALLAWCQREGLRHFTKRQAQRESPCRNGSRLDCATLLLEKAGWIASVARVAASRGGGYKVLFYPQEENRPPPPCDTATNENGCTKDGE